VTLILSELNLIVTEDWCELISKRPITNILESLELTPYQTVWISNVISA
jgi:sucrose phosphorylase